MNLQLNGTLSLFDDSRIGQTLAVSEFRVRKFIYTELIFIHSTYEKIPISLEVLNKTIQITSVHSIVDFIFGRNSAAGEHEKLYISSDQWLNASI